MLQESDIKSKSNIDTVKTIIEMLIGVSERN